MMAGSLFFYFIERGEDTWILGHDEMKWDEEDREDEMR